MSFIQVDQSLVTHRKTLRLARLLGLDRYAVVGRLVALWTWCLDNALTGCLGDDIDADVLADVMAWDATMGKPAELLDALLTAGFLELDTSDERLHIHDWYQHMGRLIERREADADRQRRRRARLSANAADAADAADADVADAVLDADVTGDDALPVMRTSRRRHADVTRQSRGEKNRVEQSRSTSQDSGSPERERAHERHEAADAALSLVTAAAPVVDLPATPSATPATSPSSNPANPANPASKRAKPSAKVTPLAAAAAARVRDPVWDACIAAMGAAPSNRVERGKWATGIKALKESLSAAAPPGSPITEAIAAEIHVRAQRYRTRFGTSVPLNPMALAGNWTTLAQDIREDQRHGNFGNFTQSRNGQHAAYGRHGGRHDDRPAVGTPAYYAQAQPQPQPQPQPQRRQA